MPAFLVDGIPLLEPLSEQLQPPVAEVRPPMTVSEESVEPSSTTIASNRSNDWASTLSIARPTNLSPLKHGMITETIGSGAFVCA